MALRWNKRTGTAGPKARYKVEPHKQGHRLVLTDPDDATIAEMLRLPTHFTGEGSDEQARLAAEELHARRNPPAMGVFGPLDPNDIPRVLQLSTAPGPGSEH